MTRVKICPSIYHNGQEISVFRDIGGPGDRSLTNDIERFVEQTLQMFDTILPFFLYYDSQGVLTGVNIKDSKFHSFFQPNELLHKDCVEPDAPWMACCVCDRPIKTCERREPIDDSYLCPVHKDGSELTDGRWVCSDECHDKIVVVDEE